MKTFVAISALLAVASAAPKPEADPQFLLAGAYAAPVVVKPALTIEPHVDPVSGQRQVKFSNGAVVPEEPLAVQLARGAHLTTKALTYAAHYPYHYLGKREAEADAEPEAFYGYAGYPYYGYGYPHHGYYGHPLITSIGAFTTYSNGAVVPTNTPAVAKATADHLAAKGAIVAAKGLPFVALGRKKREAEAKADPYYVAAVPINHSGITSIAGGLTTYANGAVVPTDHNLLAAEGAHYLSHALAYPYGGLYYGK